MQNLIQVLENEVYDVNESENTSVDSSVICGITARIKRFMLSILSPNMMLRWRGHQFSAKLIKAERESSLPLPDKIILVSRAITLCYEKFDFAPASLEIMLAKKAEEMNKGLLRQLAV